MKNFKITVLTILLVLCFCPICFGKENKSMSSNRGYVGTLPDLTRKNTVQEPEKPKMEAIPAKEFESEKVLKPVPIENPTFVNIILKPDKKSQYVNDLVEFIPILEEISDLIEDDSGVQLFNAKVFYFSKNATYFGEKYEGKPESYYVSYKKLMELNKHAQSVALLRTEAIKYNPYLMYQSEGYLYSPNNIREQLEYLKTEIGEVILVLRDTKDN